MSLGLFLLLRVVLLFAVIFAIIFTSCILQAPDRSVQRRASTRELPSGVCSVGPHLSLYIGPRFLDFSFETSATGLFVRYLACSITRLLDFVVTIATTKVMKVWYGCIISHQSLLLARITGRSSRQPCHVRCSVEFEICMRDMHVEHLLVLDLEHSAMFGRF